MSPRSSLSGISLALVALFGAAILAAGASFSTSSVAHAAPSCIELVQEVKAATAASGKVDQAKFQAAIACLQALNQGQGQAQVPGSPAAVSPTNPPVQSTFLPPFVVATYGLNVGLAAACIEFYSDWTVKESTSVYSGGSYGPFVQEASGWWLGLWPPFGAVFGLSGDGETLGYTYGFTGGMFSTEDAAFNLLPIVLVFNCNNLILQF